MRNVRFYGPFSGALQKLSRARDHEAELRKLVAEYCESEPFDLEWSREDDWGVYRIRATTSAPVEISLTAGDALHNARAALDHVVCELAERYDASTPAAMQKWIGFPIREKRRRFREQVDGLVDRVGSGAAEWLRAAEAYASGNRQLWQLDELDNLDKHRALYTSTTYHRVTEVEPPVNPMSNTSFFEMPAVRLYFGALADGAVALRVRSETPLDVPPRLTVVVGLDEPSIVGDEPLVDIVDGLISAASNEVGRLRNRAESVGGWGWHEEDGD